MQIRKYNTLYGLISAWIKLIESKVVFLKIPILATDFKVFFLIYPRKFVSQFVKINPRKIFQGRHSRKLIHAKINPCKVPLST